MEQLASNPLLDSGWRSCFHDGGLQSPACHIGPGNNIEALQSASWHPHDQHLHPGTAFNTAIQTPIFHDYAFQKKPQKQQEGNTCLIPTFEFSEKCKVGQGWGKKRELADNYQGILSSPLLVQLTKTLEMSPWVLWWANAERTIQMSQQVPPILVLRSQMRTWGTWHLRSCSQFLQTLSSWILLCKPFLVPSPLERFTTTLLVLLLPILQERKLRPTWLKYSVSHGHGG